MGKSKPYYVFRNKTEKPTTFFHATLSWKASAILSFGLLPAASLGYKRDRHGLSDPEYVHLMPTRESAEDHARLLRQNIRDSSPVLSEVVILRLTLPRAIVKKLEFDFATDSAAYSRLGYRYKGMIPARYIKLDDHE